MFPLIRHEEYYVPEKEISKRMASLKSFMKNLDISLVWINYLTDLFYFTGSIQNGILLVPVEGLPIYLVKRSVQRAELESPLEVVPYPGLKRILKMIKTMLGNNGQLGLALDVTPASTYRLLCNEIPGHKLVDISATLIRQKAVKSSWEINQIKRAVQQAETIFNEMDEYLKAGITETELSATIERRLRLLGHAGTIRIRNFGSELGLISAVSGDNALFPTYFDGPVGGDGLYPSGVPGAGRKKIVSGETVMVDMVTSFNGYHADNARTFYLGPEIPEEAKCSHDFCLQVLEQLEKRLVPGRNCSDIYREVQSWVEGQDVPEGFMGYGENRVKFFGHGIGLELDEFPIIAGKIDLILQPNMVVAVEPKAFLRGIGPVGVENTYQITENHCKNLCQFDMRILHTEVVNDENR